MKYIAEVMNRIFNVEIREESAGREVYVDGRKLKVDWMPDTGSTMKIVIIDGKPYETDWSWNGDKMLIRVNQNNLEVNINMEGFRKAGSGKNKNHSESEEILAPMPGMVVDIKIKSGCRVKDGEALIILEAMKMENEIRCPFDAIVREVFVEKGMSVEKGQRLVKIKKNR